MKFTLHQLQVFLKVTQNQSITKAAEELHLTQPAVSIQLRNFQDQFDMPLTEVIGRKLYVTDFGKEIAQTAEKIIDEVYAINYKTSAYRGQLSGRLKISVVSTGKYVMPYLLTDFLAQNPEVELAMDVTNKSKVVESLSNNEVDFSLVSILPEKLKVTNIRLMENKLFLIAHSAADFHDSSYDKGIFDELSLIYREAGSGTRFVMDNFFNQNKLSVRKKFELTSNEAVKQAVVAGLGLSVMPLIGIKHELLNGELQIVPVKGLPIKSHWQMIWLQNKKLSRVAQAFKDYLETHKETIIHKYFGWVDAW